MLRLAGIAFDPHTTLKELHDRVDLGISPRDKATQDNAPPKQGVTLSTIHAAKGGEWQYVLVLDIYDENLSRNGELDVDDEAEFRVFHVALTRAKHQTYLFTLKHEAYVDALSLNREGQPNVTNIAAVNKHQYSTLRFLPPYKNVENLCSYQPTPLCQDRSRLPWEDLCEDGASPTRGLAPAEGLTFSRPTGSLDVSPSAGAARAPWDHEPGDER